MRLLLINPNTTTAMTEHMVTLARARVGSAAEIIGVTGRFGARYVASRASYAVAGHASLDAYAASGRNADVVLLACFGDPALFALRELATVPVVGMAEASCRQAASRGRFSIVTGGERWGPMLTEFVASISLSDHLAGVITVAPTGADIAENPDGALTLLADACRRAAVEQAADAVILGGAGLAGIAARIADRVPVPLVDSLDAILDAGLAVARTPPSKPKSGPDAQTPAVETVGLSPDLAAAFA